MSVYFEIAYAAAAKRLCLFTGTGFSMALTEGKMPNWQQLLESLCDEQLEGDELKLSLFPNGENERNPLQLEEAAQVIAMEMTRADKSVYDEIAKLIEVIGVSASMPKLENFLKTRPFRVVTTNYDKLVESLIGTECQSLSPGLPIPRSNSRAKVFHVHGSVDVPDRMVVTSDDYFEFMNADTYFSRKLSTVLYENTVVILGYSLRDTNLRAILNEYSGFARNHNSSSSIFFVSRTPVEQSIVDYYANCYGIRVIDSTEVEDFFGQVERQYDRATGVYERSLKSINQVLHHGKKFKPSFLKLNTSFFDITSAIGASGESLESAKVVKMFGQIITAKKELCGETGAWEQYAHLAAWLIHLGSLIEVEGRSIEDSYLEAVLFSMKTMSAKYKGYSWQAYGKWNVGWKSVNASNRSLIRTYVSKNSSDEEINTIILRR